MVIRHTASLSLKMLGLAIVLLPGAAAAQTLDRVKSTGDLRVAYVQSATPFSSETDGKVTGYSIALCQRIAEALQAKLGIPKVMSVYTGASVPGALDAVANGQADILCGSTTDTLERRQRVSFSLPIYNGGIGVVLAKDAPPDLVRVLRGQEANPGPKWRATINQGLADHTYAVHQGTVTEAWVRERVATLGVIATIVPVKDHQTGVDMVEDGQADAYFADRAILLNYVNRDKYSNLMVLDRYFTFEPIALALPRSDEDFRLLVDTALSTLYRSDDFAPLYTRYFGKPSDVTLMLFKSYARQ